MRKLVVTAFAVGCLLVGLLTVWTPIPTGLPLLAIGLTLLISTDRRAARMVKNVRKRYRPVDNGFLWIEDRTSGKLLKILRRTRPRRAAMPPAGRSVQHS